MQIDILKQQRGCGSRALNKSHLIIMPFIMSRLQLKVQCSSATTVMQLQHAVHTFLLTPTSPFTVNTLR